jgi:uncharacterized protein
LLPLYFGTSSARLFGVYHPAQAAPVRTCGVVLCPPGGHEYIRAHRALRQVAMSLSAAGFHVFRFDYFGSGDSAGEADEAGVRRWVADIRAAIEELKDTAGVPRVSLVGLRLGATLAAQVAEDRTDIDTLLLWDPVTSGRRYLRDLRRLQRRWLHDRPGSRLFAFSPRVTEVIGFPVTSTMRAELVQLDLRALRTTVRRIVVAGSDDQQAGRDWIVEPGMPLPGEIDRPDHPAGDWHRPELVHTALLAPRVVERVGRLLQEHVR